MLSSHMWSAFYDGYTKFNEHSLEMDLRPCLPGNVLDIEINF